MITLEDVGEITNDLLTERFNLQTAQLERPFPLRPLKMLGLLKFDGWAYTSEKFLRVLIMKTSLLVRGGCSVFICPHAEYHLPVFTTEVFFFGKKIIFLVDVQQAFAAGSHSNEWFFDKLLSIREGYKDLLRNPRPVKGKIAELYSPAACYATLAKEQANRALSIYRQYLDAYCDLVASAEPATGYRLSKARQDLETYIDIMINHDPAMKMAYLCFGKKGGIQWAMNLFYGR